MKIPMLVASALVALALPTFAAVSPDGVESVEGAFTAVDLVPVKTVFRPAAAESSTLILAAAVTLRANASETLRLRGYRGLTADTALTLSPSTCRVVAAEDGEESWAAGSNATSTAVLDAAIHAAKANVTNATAMLDAAKKSVIAKGRAHTDADNALETTQKFLSSLSNVLSTPDVGARLEQLLATFSRVEQKVASAVEVERSALTALEDAKALVQARLLLLRDAKDWLKQLTSKRDKQSRREKERRSYVDVVVWCSSPAPSACDASLPQGAKTDCATAAKSSPATVDVSVEVAVPITNGLWWVPKYTVHADTAAETAAIDVAATLVPGDVCDSIIRSEEPLPWEDDADRETDEDDIVLLRDVEVEITAGGNQHNGTLPSLEAVRLKAAAADGPAQKTYKTAQRSRSRSSSTQQRMKRHMNQDEYQNQFGGAQPFGSATPTATASMHDGSEESATMDHDDNTEAGDDDSGDGQEEEAPDVAATQHGERLSFTLPGRHTLRCRTRRARRHSAERGRLWLDEEPSRVVAIDTLQTTAALKYISVPQKSQQVFAFLELTNPATFALSPANAAVYIDGERRGTAAVPFVAPKGNTSLAVGTADGLRVTWKRGKDHRGQTSSLFAAKRTVRDIGFDVTVTNARHRPAKVEVRAALPVSGHNGITVDIAEATRKTAGFQVTEAGMATWRVEVSPGAAVVIPVLYGVGVDEGVRFDVGEL